MYMQIRLPLICFLIVAYCFWSYTRKKRLRTRTSRVYSALMIVTILNLAATTVTEYTVNNRDAVSEPCNYVWHILFITSLTCAVTLLVFYLLVMIESSTGKHQNREKCVLFIVALLGVVTQVVLPIEYIDTPHGSYSLGPKAWSLYVVVVLDLILLVCKTLRYQKALGRGKSNLIITSTAVYLVAAALQIRWPYLLLTDAALTMIAVGLTVGTQDNYLYLNLRTNLFNDIAGREIISERLFDDSPFQVGVYVFLGEDGAIDREMIRLEEQIRQMHSHPVCCMMQEHLLVVLPLSGLMGETRLPAALPLPETDAPGFRCKTGRLEFTGQEDLETVQNTIRDLQLRYEAEDLQIDELTRLLRREAFSVQVNGMLERGTPFSFLMVDLDDFKNVNDTYGHQVGDQVLQGCAEVFRSVVRTSDLICRMGGDEFAIVLSGALHREEIEQIAGRMMEQLSRLAALPDGSGGLRVSVGVKSFCPPQEDASFETIYDQADSAMYQVKRQGKNGIGFGD